MPIFFHCSNLSKNVTSTKTHSLITPTTEPSLQKSLYLYTILLLYFLHNTFSLWNYLLCLYESVLVVWPHHKRVHCPKSRGCIIFSLCTSRAWNSVEEINALCCGCWTIPNPCAAGLQLSVITPLAFILVFMTLTTTKLKTQNLFPSHARCPLTSGNRGSCSNPESPSSFAEKGNTHVKTAYSRELIYCYQRTNAHVST